ncbi:MAG: ATP-binding cassette domain-containing protein [Gammaproteobacteria bacterium]|nr:ATP-binding cassette domain-containing protein [Gammaproteobacteria bacterium]
MLNFSNISIFRGSTLLMEDVNFIIHRGQKVGVTGSNGCGKSTLFALLMGKLSVDQGEFSMPDRLSIAHVRQDADPLPIPAIDYVLQGDVEYCDIQQQLKVAEDKQDGHVISDLHAKLHDIGGYDANSRAAKLLSGLGFKDDEITNNVSSFSGGWIMRLNLAQALMCRSDLLLLDEPTNHLDLDAVIWLEDWLERYQGTLLLISHDKDFLDRTINHIAHIEQKKMDYYTGNYSDFERLRAEKLALQASSYEKQQKEIAHMEDFVRRFKAKASKAKQAQSRVKALERMTLINAAHIDSPFSFHFNQPKSLPDTLLNLHEVNIGYDTTTILNKVSLTIHPGDRIGLLGFNGAGKSTLVKCLANELKAQAGHIDSAKDLNIGYFAQHQVEQLDLQASALLHLQRMSPEATEKELRTYLGSFNFRDDKALDPVAPFSGGEKARLVLALIIWQKPNLLLLDEPTNHLDLEMRHALNLALQNFDGALILVSHDRYMLRTVCDQLWLVNQGNVAQFKMDIDDYPKWLAEQKRVTESANTSSTAGKKNTAQEKKKLSAEIRKKIQPLTKQLTLLERKMATAEKQKATINHQLADNELYTAKNKEQLKKLLLEQKQNEDKVDQLEEQWFELSESIETLKDE